MAACYFNQLELNERRSKDPKINGIVYFDTLSTDFCIIFSNGDDVGLIVPELEPALQA